MQSPRRLVARAARAGTPGLIAPGPGFCLPRIEESLWQFLPLRNDGASFAANLLRAGVAHPQDWETTQKVGPFLQRTLERFVGNRAREIDHAFDIALSLSTTGTNWRTEEEINPHKIVLTFRVAHTVGWVNLTPALEMLKADHDLLPSFFYHWFERALSRWFRVFDVREAKYSWESWMERREEDEAENGENGERDGLPYKPPEFTSEPRLPECIREISQNKLPAVQTLTRRLRTRRLMQAVEYLHHTARRGRCPTLDRQDREDMFYDTDPAIPLICVAFGDHDVITEMLNMELEYSGQVEAEPLPVLLIDGTDPQSIRRAFRCANIALNTLLAASKVLSLIPGFEPMHRENS